MSIPRIVLAAGLVVLAQVVDAALLARWGWPGVTPDLTLLVVVALALLGGTRAGAGAGLAAGLVADLTPPGAAPLAATALAYCLGGAVAGRWHRRGERSLVLPVLAAATAGLVVGVVQAVVAAAAGAGTGLGELALRCAVSAGYAAAGSLVVVPLVVWLDRVVEGEAAEAVRL